MNKHLEKFHRKDTENLLEHKCETISRNRVFLPGTAANWSAMGMRPALSQRMPFLVAAMRLPGSMPCLRITSHTRNQKADHPYRKPDLS